MQDYVLIQLHMLELNVCKDRQVIKCMSDAGEVFLMLAIYYATMAEEHAGYVLY